VKYNLKALETFLAVVLEHFRERLKIQTLTERVLSFLFLWKSKKLCCASKSTIEWQSING